MIHLAMRDRRACAAALAGPAGDVGSRVPADPLSVVPGLNSPARSGRAAVSEGPEHPAMGVGGQAGGAHATATIAVQEGANPVEFLLHALAGCVTAARYGARDHHRSSNGRREGR
jgi:hypothetical protein